ncbi:MAG TPA: PqqD family protein [Pyrinomonadaceae bacterium]|nr:PqqD family protein [Pyrinomonadaceae bacterium]
MKRTTPPQLPRMREDALVIDELPDEVLVYDVNQHRAHCLNQSAALVWRACDGNRTPSEIANMVSAELATPFSESLVRLALGQLEKASLLEEAQSVSPQYLVLSRRRMVRHFGLVAAVVVPAVISIVVPTPAQAATCTPSGQPCNPVKLCCTACNPAAPGGPKCF